MTAKAFKENDEWVIECPVCLSLLVILVTELPMTFRHCGEEFDVEEEAYESN